MSGEGTAPAGIALLAERGVLAVSGPDRAGFLQGLLTNSVLEIDGGRPAYAALLSPQGKFLHDMVIVAARLGESAGDSVWLVDAEAARLDDLVRRLRIYRLRSKVTVAAAPEQAVVAAFGDDAASRFDLTDSAAAVRFGGVAFRDPRLAGLGVRWIGPRDAVAGLPAETGLPEADAADYDRLRLTLGVPDGSRDLVVDRTVLLEADLDALNAIAWDKGCYVGQEVTARTRYRGLVRKRLLPVTVDGPLPGPGTPILLEGAEVGEVRSGRGDRALALLRIEEAAPALAGIEPLVAGGARLTPHWPDWLPRPKA